MFLFAVFNSEQRNRCRRKSRIPLIKQTTMFIVLSPVVFCSFPIIGRLFSETLRIESLQLVCISARAEMDMRKRKSRISLKRQTANFHCLSSVSVLQFSNCREVLFSQTSTIRSFAAQYALSLSLQFQTLLFSVSCLVQTRNIRSMERSSIFMSRILKI